MPPPNFNLQNLGTDDVRRAIFERLRYQAAEPATRIAQNINTAGVRSSGVSLIPMQEAARQRAINEAEGVIGLGTQQIGQNFQAEQAALDRQAQENLAMRNAAMQQDLEEQKNRGMLQQALLAGGFGLAGGVIQNMGKPKTEEYKTGQYR